MRILILLLPLFLFAETHFLLIRHGETDWNVENRMQGVTDNPLNDKGLSQAEELSVTLTDLHPDIAAIYSSDLNRAITTAEATASKLSLPISQNPSFREYNWGELEGWDISYLFDHFRAAAIAWKEAYSNRQERWDHTIYPGAETFNQLMQRMKRGLVTLANEHPDKKVAIFTHARAIRTFMAEVMDKEVDQVDHLPNCAIVHVFYNSETGNFQLGEVEGAISH